MDDDTNNKLAGAAGGMAVIAVNLIWLAVVLIGGPFACYILVG
jgi:hypothetical protein